MKHRRPTRQQTADLLLVILLVVAVIVVSSTATHDAEGAVALGLVFAVGLAILMWRRFGAKR